MFILSMLSTLGAEGMGRIWEKGDPSPPEYAHAIPLWDYKEYTWDSPIYVKCIQSPTELLQIEP